MKKLLFFILTVFAVFPLSGRAAEVSSLAGEWRFALDRDDVGVSGKWFAKDLKDTIRLPGVLQAQGYGDDIATNTPWVSSLGDAWWKIQPQELREPFSQPGNVKVPFLSQPPKHYLGAAWYQREVVIPSGSPQQHYTLLLERAHWKSTVWLDEKEFPANNSLGAPHISDLGVLAPGKHRLTIRVDNRTQLPPLGHLVDSHSISDALGATWNGIVGKIELQATPPVWIDDLQVFPHIANKSVTVKGRIGNASGESGHDTFGIKVTPVTASAPVVASTNVPVTWSTDGGAFEVELSLNSDAGVWDEFHPVNFRLAVRLEHFGSASTQFGLREVTARDKDIMVNGRPVNLRMTHFGGDFPLTGYPAMDVGSWKKIIRACKDYGLNGIRFHSWCPPEAAFEAADELGFYLQPECGLWADFGNAETREFLEAETARILKAYGNHPSFILLAPSNEPKNYSRYLPQWAKENYAKDDRHLYSAATGWSDPSQVTGGAQFATMVRYGKGQLRNATGWFGGDYSEALNDVNVPVLSHEVGQWCAYPDFDVIKKFTGYLRPGNYEIFKYIAEKNGVLDMDRDFAWASGRFQLDCYKEEIEANLRTPGLAGFQLLDLHDYLGQGTALIGVLDAFWESKGYATPAEFKKFCGPIVPLAWLKKRVFTTDEKLKGSVGLAQFGPVDLTNAVVRWTICDGSGKVVVACPTNISRSLPVGFKGQCMDLAVDLSQLAAPGKYKLVAEVQSTSGQFQNDWTFWLYPAHVEDSKGDAVLVTRVWREAEQKLTAGGKVLFVPPAEDLDPSKCPPMSKVPVFWNIQMTVRPPQNPRPRFDAMLGLLCDTNHPALAEFPTDKNCDWHWTPLINGVRPVNLTAARDLHPIVWAIDDWNRNWKLGVIFECNVASGKLLVSTINLNDERANSEVKQLRRSLLDYAGSERFKPATTLTLQQVQEFWSHGKSDAPTPKRVFDPDLNDGSIPASTNK